MICRSERDKWKKDIAIKHLIYYIVLLYLDIQGIPKHSYAYWMHLIIEPFCLPHVDVLIKILKILQHKFFSFISGMHFIFLWIAWVVSSGYFSSYITLMDILKHLPWKYPCIDRESFFIAAENQECLSGRGI